MPLIRRKIAGNWALLPAWMGAMVGFVLAVGVAAIVAVMGLIGLAAALVRRAIGGRMPKPLAGAQPKPAIQAIPMQRAEDGTWHPGPR